MVVTFNVKRVPVFRFITIRSRDCNSFKSIVRDTKIPCHLLKVETGFNRRADLVRPHSELRAHKPYDCGIASNQRWRSFLEFWFLNWISLGCDCCFYRFMCSINNDRRLCGVAWLFHLNNIAKAIVIVDVKTASGRKHFLKLLYAPIW